MQGWFEPLVEGLASGPPLWRVEQMLAVHRAGLLTWAGPAPVVDAEERAFSVRSPQVGAADSLGPAVVEGEWLVEAMMPPNRVQAASSPLIRGMLDDGVAAAHAIRALPGPAARLPILALTANADERDEADYVAAGMNGCLLYTSPSPRD